MNDGMNILSIMWPLCFLLDLPGTPGYSISPESLSSNTPGVNIAVYLVRAYYPNISIPLGDAENNIPRIDMKYYRWDQRSISRIWLWRWVWMRSDTLVWWFITLLPGKGDHTSQVCLQECWSSNSFFQNLGQTFWWPLWGCFLLLSPYMTFF